MSWSTLYHMEKSNFHQTRFIDRSNLTSFDLPPTMLTFDKIIIRPEKFLLHFISISFKFSFHLPSDLMYVLLTTKLAYHCSIKLYSIVFSISSGFTLKYDCEIDKLLLTKFSLNSWRLTLGPVSVTSNPFLRPQWCVRSLAGHNWRVIQLWLAINALSSCRKLGRA